MFSYIKGELTELSPGSATIEASGVGYALTISAATHGALSFLSSPSSAKLYTYLSIREDGMELFGFSDREELDFFRMLIGVSGVGPKAAMSILSSLTVSELVGAIMTDRPKVIATAPMIGPKTASRIILELKDKVTGGSYTHSGAESATIKAPDSSASKMLDAESALEVLGYTRSEIQNALRDMDLSKMSVEDIIRVCLSKMT